MFAPNKHGCTHTCGKLEKVQYRLLLLLMLTDNRQTHRHTEFLARLVTWPYQIEISSVNLPMADQLDFELFSKINWRMVRSKFILVFCNGSPHTSYYCISCHIKECRLTDVFHIAIVFELYDYSFCHLELMLNDMMNNCTIFLFTCEPRKKS